LLLDERSATVVAIIMLVVFAVTRPIGKRWSRFISAAAFETAIVCALFALWQAANQLTRGHTTGGLERGRAIWHAERWMHMLNELAVQNWIIDHPRIVKASNYYYDTMHLTLMVVFLIWLWLRHRDRYPYFRNMIAAFTAMSLLIQMIAVAPPRLIGGTGMIDTAQVYGQSVYAVFGDLSDQYAAMPSIHVGWAILISYAVVKVSPSRFRWLAILHGAITSFVVVATANHYWLDGIAAVALLVVAHYIAKAVEVLKARVLTPAPASLPALTPVAEPREVGV
jgi:hypothetical protein